MKRFSLFVLGAVVGAVLVTFLTGGAEALLGGLVLGVGIGVVSGTIDLVLRRSSSVD